MYWRDEIAILCYNELTRQIEEGPISSYTSPHIHLLHLMTTVEPMSADVSKVRFSGCTCPIVVIFGGRINEIFGSKRWTSRLPEFES